MGSSLACVGCVDDRKLPDDKLEGAALPAFDHEWWAGVFQGRGVSSMVGRHDLEERWRQHGFDSTRSMTSKSCVMAATVDLHDPASYSCDLSAALDMAPCDTHCSSDADTSAGEDTSDASIRASVPPPSARVAARRPKWDGVRGRSKTEIEKVLGLGVVAERLRAAEKGRAAPASEAQDCKALPTVKARKRRAVLASAGGA